MLQQKVKYVFVIFYENESFDHFFDTCPGADGLFSAPAGSMPGNQTPGFSQRYLDTHLNVITPQSVFCRPTSRRPPRIRPARRSILTRPTSTRVRRSRPARQRNPAGCPELTHRSLWPAFAVVFVVLGQAASAQTLDAVRAAGRLPCGTVEAVADWNDGPDQDQNGNLSGLGTEICRAVATAIFGDPAKAEIVRFPGELKAVGALRSGGIPIAVGFSPGAEIAVQYGVGFGPLVFYDTERFLALRSSGLKSMADLRGKLVCALNNTPSERTLRDEVTARGIPYGLQAHSEQGEMDAAVAVVRCAAGAALESRLAESRADFPANAPPFVFLPERLGIDPVAPAYRYGDRKFGLIVNATVNALIEAESLGITQDNVADWKGRADMRAERLLGGDRAVGQALGLLPDWAVHVIAATGNYGEIFDRTLGRSYGLKRGINALWTAGGLMHPMPMQ